MTRSRLLALLTAIVVVGIAVGAGVFYYSSPPPPTLKEARAIHRKGDYKAAMKALDKILSANPDSEEARKLAAQVAVDANDAAKVTEQIDWFATRAPDSATAYALLMADRKLNANDVDNAETWLLRALQFDPTNMSALTQLGQMLTDQGRRWQASPMLLQIVKSGKFDLTQLLLTARTEDMLTLPREYIAQRYADRSQVGPLLGLARFGIATNGHETAEELVREVIRRRPEIVEAPIRLCEILLEKRPAEFPGEIRKLPAEAKQHPAYWTLLGKWYRRQNEPRLATACFRETLTLDPNRNIATFQLSQLLDQLGHQKTAEVFRKRAKALSTLGADLSEFFQGRGSPARVRSVSDQMADLGRNREAFAWAQYALQQGAAQWASQRLRELEPMLSDDPPRVAADANPVRLLSSADWPRPSDADLDRVAAGGTATDSSDGSEKQTPIRLADVASDAGINFKYFNGAVPASETHLMYEFTGGGVGVIDYDLDGWPEVYLPNGTKWPPGPDSEYRDGFFRNQQSTFVNVAAIAGLVESGFGQGVSVGDFDCDGFPDIYVANTNRNQLWRNNGDGTFVDATESAGLNTSVWTTSCLIADLNKDGLPDLYDANFLTGADVFTRVCDEDGRPRSCPPAEFPGERDCVLLNRGDGTFANVTETAGVTHPKSNSLGIVAADFDGSRQLNLFLANDSVPNFYYMNESTPDSIVLSESAIGAGLNVDYAGKSQACMGVGIADIDANGLLDLFITNFHNESNALYMQQAENLFSDECRPSNIRAVSQEMLGFGTQFLDIDLDGWPDLVITNGHVDDFTHEGTNYQMRPQILRHTGGENVQFIEQKPTPVGPYFASKHLGRGLARLDFNRDGLDDYGVSHLDSPFALVRNETEAHGNFVSLRLVATTTSRAAIGAVVRVTAGDRTYMHQLTAGDGYMASNERRLTVGLGQSDQACTIEVTWMSGKVEAFGQVEPNTHSILVESLGRTLTEPE
jgi:tetratricopeptide (TPR) repeat protein